MREEVRSADQICSKAVRITVLDGIVAGETGLAWAGTMAKGLEMALRFIDSVVLALMPEAASGITKILGGSLAGGYPTSKYLEKMDESGVQTCILGVTRGGRFYRQGAEPFEAWEVPLAGVQKVIAAHPGRFVGMIGINPMDRRRSLAEIEYAVTELGFVGTHLYPHWWDLDPDDRLYYPFYEKSAELDVPVQVRVGAALARFHKSVGHPISLETVARDFPELTIVASHTGWPWVEEMIAVMNVHPNVYVTTSCHYPLTDWANPVSGLRPMPKWDDALIRFANSGWVSDGSRGEDKVLMGTDFPEWEFSTMIEEAREVLTPSAFEKVCGRNAARVYKLELISEV